MSDCACKKPDWSPSDGHSRSCFFAPPKPCRHPPSKQHYFGGRCLWCTACGAIKDTEGRTWRRPGGGKMNEYLKPGPWNGFCPIHLIVWSIHDRFGYLMRCWHCAEAGRWDNEECDPED